MKGVDADSHLKDAAPTTTHRLGRAASVRATRTSTAVARTERLSPVDPAWRDALVARTRPTAAAPME